MQLANSQYKVSSKIINCATLHPSLPTSLPPSLPPSPFLPQTHLQSTVAPLLMASLQIDPLQQGSLLHIPVMSLKLSPQSHSSPSSISKFLQLSPSVVKQRSMGEREKERKRGKGREGKGER